MKPIIQILIFLSFCSLIDAQVNHWETAIYGTDTFSYFIGDKEPPSDWRTVEFNDSNWLKGIGPLGYGEDNIVTMVPSGSLSIYIRKTFNIEDTAAIYSGILNIDYDDGFVAWLNGIEVARSNLGIVGDFPPFDSLAQTSHEGLVHQGLLPETFELKHSVTSPLLKTGKNVVCMQVNNVLSSSSDLTALLYLSLGINNNNNYFGSTPDWFVNPDSYPSSLLPLLVINTHGQWIPHIPDKILVDFGIIDNGPGNYNNINDPMDYFNAKAGLGIHGSSSTMFEKKNYGLETRDELGLQLDTSILGLPTENDFVLYGPYPDKSLLRNYIMYALGNNIGQYAPRTRMCELYLDNDYRGFYLLEEKIKRDKNRVNIKKLESTDISGIKLTGGYIVKIDRTANNYTDGWWSKYRYLDTTVFFVFDYPNYTDIQPSQKQYISDKINFFEGLLKASNFTDPLNGYRTIIDSKSFAEHLILSEFCKNVDAYRLSTFMYKDRDDVDPLIYMGPIWDYDLAFGNANYDNASAIAGWEYNYPEQGQPFWWPRLMSDPWFANLVKCRYQELRKTALNTDTLDLLIDKAIEEMGPAIQRNFDRWPIHGIWVWPNNFVGATFDQDINYLKEWISERGEWMDNNLPGQCIVSDMATELSPGNNLVIFPNPAHENINIEIQNPEAEKLLLEIFNLYGQLSFSLRVNGDNYKMENIKLLPGTYFARLSSNSTIRIVNFVIY